MTTNRIPEEAVEVPARLYCSKCGTGVTFLFAGLCGFCHSGVARISARPPTKDERRDRKARRIRADDFDQR